MTDPQAASTMAPLLDAIAGSAALTVIPRAELIFVPGGAAKVLDSIKDKARADAAKLDVSRPKDRKAIISLSMDLRHLKVAGDESGKSLKAEYQAKITPIDAERRVWREEMDALADEIRRPVTEFEAAEETRIREHEAACNDLVWPKFTDNMEPSSAEAAALIDALDHMHVARNWQEFADRATATRTNSRNALLVAQMKAQQREAAEAEAARLAEEAAEAARQEAARLQAAREAEIARQAAETARVAAETAAREEAARVAAEAAQRAQEAADALAREQQEKREAEERATRLEAEKEADRVKGHRTLLADIREYLTWTNAPSSKISEAIAAVIEFAPPDTLIDWQEFTEEAAALCHEVRFQLEAAFEAAEARESEQARRQQEEAAAKAETARLAAIEAERQRVEGERLREEAATRQREASVAHARKIHREAMDDLVKAGLSEQAAKAAVTALARKEVRHCVISY